MALYTFLSRFLRVLPASRTKVRAGRVLTRLCVHGTTSSVAEVRLRDGSRMLLDARSRTEAGAFWNGEFDRDDIDFFKVCLSFGRMCFDVGANVGLIAIPLARYLRDHGGGTVIAFEPVAANFQRLVKTIALNQLEEIVVPINVALGDAEGEIEMALQTQGGASTGNAAIAGPAENPAGYTVSTARITRLDSLVIARGIPHVDFIKVDIEGAELLFLQGAQAFLQKSRPIIYGEFNAEMMPKFGHGFPDVVNLVRPWNYRIFGFVARLQPVEVLDPQVGLGNVFLVPAERAEELLRRVAAARRKDETP